MIWSSGVHRVSIEPLIVTQLVAAAGVAVPYEAGGLLFGAVDRDGTLVVSAAWIAPYVGDRESFAFRGPLPIDIVHAPPDGSLVRVHTREMAIGVWHSHTTGSRWHSQQDRVWLHAARATEAWLAASVVIDAGRIGAPGQVGSVVAVTPSGLVDLVAGPLSTRA